VAVVVRAPSFYQLYVDGQPAFDVLEERLDATSSMLTMSVSGSTGSISVFEMRVHEAP
jgi:hypothetical protein